MDFKINYKTTNAIILAGGASSRMGFDKAFLEWEGAPLIERQINLLKGIFEKIIIAINNTGKAIRYKEILNEYKNIGLVSDIIASSGPLSGIHSGLIASDCFYNFVVACDMPFLNEPLIRHMLENKAGYDAIIPKVNRKLHPLFGIYAKKCILPIEKMLKAGNFKVSDLFSKIKTKYITKQMIKEFDERFLSLSNINSKDDVLCLR